MPLMTTRPARNWEATLRALEVGPEDGTMEAIPGVVGDSDGLLLRVVSNHAKHGAENLLPGDRHVVLHVDKHRGLREETRVETVRMSLSPDQYLGTLFDPLADVGLNSFVLPLRHHRPDACL